MDASALSTHLSGDWTIAGIASQLDSLMALSGQWDNSSPAVHIDCSGIEQIDMSGFQLLHVWLHCLEIRGFEPKLVNIPESVENSRYRLGFVRCSINVAA